MFTLWCVIKIDTFLKIDTCLDGGEIWDYNEKRCRNDCLLWNEIYGCVQMTPEELKIFHACSGKKYSDETCDRKEFEKIFGDVCKRYQVPIDLKSGQCSFEKRLFK